jgi:hypothetical protein
MKYLELKHEKEIDDAKSKAVEGDPKTAESDAKLQEVLKNVQIETDGFIATAMKVEFGASISDILLKSPDVGLHASNILLGIPDKDDKIDKSVQINSTKTLLNMAEGKLKIQTMNKKIKEFELSQLKKLQDAGGQVDKKEIAKLEAEVIELEEEVSQSQNSVTRVEKDISNLLKD